MQEIDRAFLEGVALLDLDERESVLEVRGVDAEDYLQRMLSCDLRKVTATDAGGQGRAGTLMTGKGKLIAPFHCHRLPSDPSSARFWLFAERSALEPLEAALERLVILEDVTFDRPDVVILSLQGPRADAALSGESVGGEALPEEEQERARVELGEGEPGWVVRRTRSVAGGWDFVLPRSSRDRFVSHWIEQGAQLAEPAAIDRHRVLAAEPRFGIDGTAENLPPEVGYDDAIAYDKGCYAGQEVVARIRTYGHVNRRLCQLRTASPKVEVGEELTPVGAEDPKPVAKVTTTAVDPRGEGTVMLAIVRYRHATVGNELALSDGGVATIAQIIGESSSP